jgi:Bax protein
MNEQKPKATRRHALRAALVVLTAGGLLLMIVNALYPGARSLPEPHGDDIAARKAAFFEFLVPIVRQHNGRIREERAWLLAIDDSRSLGFLDRRRYAALATRYDVNLQELSPAKTQALLRRRVDVIPEALVLIQAAKESGWGSSRFAQDGNALFGEWCFTRGCGMVPSDRGADSSHEVRSFDSVHEAVGSYMDVINSHSSYADLRIAREQMRASGEPLSALRLAEHLSEYSERGDAYVQEVQSMIIENGLEAG